MLLLSRHISVEKIHIIYENNIHINYLLFINGSLLTGEISETTRRRNCTECICWDRIENTVNSLAEHFYIWDFNNIFIFFVHFGSWSTVHGPIEGTFEVYRWARLSYQEKLFKINEMFSYFVSNPLCFILMARCCFISNRKSYLDRWADSSTHKSHFRIGIAFDIAQLLPASHEVFVANNLLSHPLLINACTAHTQLFILLCETHSTDFSFHLC